MTRTTYTVHTDDGHTLTIDTAGSTQFHLRGKVPVNADTFVSSGKMCGCVTIGPVKVFCDPDLVRALEPAILGYEADRARGPIERIARENTARLRADANSDDGTRVADAHAEQAVLTDYARAKGRL